MEASLDSLLLIIAAIVDRATDPGGTVVSQHYELVCSEFELFQPLDLRR